MKTKVFVPKSFAVKPNARIKFENCTFHSFEESIKPTMHVFKHTFSGVEVLKDAEIYFDGNIDDFKEFVEYHNTMEAELSL